MKYNVSDDLSFFLKCKKITLHQLSNELDISLETLSRIINNKAYPSDENLEKIYSYIYKENIKLNEIKVKTYQAKKDIILFHGSRDMIIGDLSLDYSRERVDFGKGFYVGDNYAQSLDFISLSNRGSIYVMEVDYNDLKILTLDVSLDWLLMVGINRSKLDEYQNTKKYKELVETLNSYDVIIAPIADNRMFTTIEDFASSAISSMQAVHALKDLSLGKQIVFKTEKSLKHIKLLERLYVCKKEKEEAKKVKLQKINDSDEYIKEAYKKYIRQGQYINEVFK